MWRLRRAAVACCTLTVEWSRSKWISKNIKNHLTGTGCGL
uniref:OPA1 mitochondrial dynamin like GTPase n=1 Tax=Homo sapiens TaxID=9606 RepID=A0A2R8Y514_HUMAN